MVDSLPPHFPDSLYLIQVEILDELNIHKRGLTITQLYRQFDLKYTKMKIGRMLVEMKAMKIVDREFIRGFPTKYYLNNKGKLLLEKLNLIVIKDNLADCEIKSNVFRMPIKNRLRLV